MEKIWQQAPYNYSASLWIRNFSIRLWEHPNPLIFMISGFLDVTMTPKTNIIYLLRHQDSSNNQRTSPNHFHIYYFGNLNISEIICLKMVEKPSTEQSWRSVLNFLGNLAYGINIFQRTWNATLVLSEQDPPEQHYMICWNFETLQPRN